MKINDFMIVNNSWLEELKGLKSRKPMNPEIILRNGRVKFAKFVCQYWPKGYFIVYYPLLENGDFGRYTTLKAFRSFLKGSSRKHSIEGFPKNLSETNIKLLKEWCGIN